MDVLTEVVDYKEEVSNDEDEPPSTSSTSEQLDDFRSQWHHEINVRDGDKVKAKLSNQEVEIEAKAKELFMEGANLEQHGDLYEAIRYYRKAVQLVPDIEFRIEDFQQLHKPRRERLDSESSIVSCQSECDDEDLDDLIYHFNKIRLKEDEVRSTCLPDRPTQMTHISALPVEVLMYIFKWVISDRQDFQTLEHLSMVCQGFYLCARDEDLWRSACLCLWGTQCGTEENYGTWRNMFISRPHLQFNGCYISKTTYFRQGEPSLDSFYRPCQTVEYYRYARFFPDGHLITYTNAEDPQQSVSRLQPNNLTQGILHGHYKLTGNIVTAIWQSLPETDLSNMKYKRRRQNAYRECFDKTFNAEFILKNGHGSKNNQLCWHEYSVTIKNRETGNEATTDFHLTKSAFPPFNFSRVKSYSLDADRPLT